MAQTRSPGLKNNPKEENQTPLMGQPLCRGGNRDRVYRSQRARKAQGGVKNLEPFQKNFLIVDFFSQKEKDFFKGNFKKPWFTPE